MSENQSVLDCLSNLPILVTRFMPGRLVGGKLKASKAKPYYISASVQVANGREREYLPEGWRQSYVVKVYCTEKLLVSDDQKNQRADLLTINKENFEVIVTEQQRGLGLDHFKVYAARRND